MAVRRRSGAPASHMPAWRLVAALVHAPDRPRHDEAHLPSCRFYHADPHPGNLLRTADGRLAYIDFGMMGSVDSNIRK